MRRHQMRQCDNQACAMRFPVDQGSPLGASCPRCGAPTHESGGSYASHGAHDQDVVAGGPRLVVLLDNVRSLRNVGSMFRTADGLGIAHMHLGGVTPTPDHPGMAKTALGAERAVPWTYHADSVQAATRLCDEGLRLWALEGGSRSVPIFDVLPELAGPTVALVLGHEVAGIDPRILELCERVMRLPMVGIKGSLNVSVALGVAAYTLRYAPNLAAATAQP